MSLTSRQVQGDSIGAGETLRVAVITRVGERNVANQDRVVVNNTVIASEQRTVAMFNPQLPCLVAVFDGLGGHRGGDIAAALAADVVASGSRSIATEDDLIELVEEANRHLYRIMYDYFSLDGMGTTVAGVYVTPDAMTVFHVGDSRVYTYADGNLTAETADDANPRTGLITQVLGGSNRFTPIRVHTSALPSAGGRILAATDGLFSLADPDSLSEAMKGPLDSVPDQLHEVAVNSRNPDDFTVAVIETTPKGGSPTGGG